MLLSQSTLLTGVFAYPTEAVYGLGCSPFDESAVQRILHIKQRPLHQRFILIAADWHQIQPLIQIQLLSPERLAHINASWPGPVTWVFPAADNTPAWLVNDNKTIALRITAHPIASALCHVAGTPLISTSANISGTPPCRTYEETLAIFGDQVDDIVPGEVDLSAKPTSIYDALTGKVLRL